MPTNLPDKLTTPSTVVCQSPDCDVDTDFCDHPKIDVDKQNMQDDVELLTTFADGAGEGSLPWNSDGKCTPTGVPSFKSLMAWLGLQFTQVYCALQNIYNQICEMLKRKRVSKVSTGFRTIDETPDFQINAGDPDYQYTLASNGPLNDISDGAYNEIINDGDRVMNCTNIIVSSPTVYGTGICQILTELRSWDFGTSTWSSWGMIGLAYSGFLLSAQSDMQLLRQLAPGEIWRFQVRTSIGCGSGTIYVDKWAASFREISVWEEVSI